MTDNLDLEKKKWELAKFKMDTIVSMARDAAIVLGIVISMLTNVAMYFGSNKGPSPATHTIAVAEASAAVDSVGMGGSASRSTTRVSGGRLLAREELRALEAAASPAIERALTGKNFGLLVISALLIGVLFIRKRKVKK